MFRVFSHSACQWQRPRATPPQTLVLVCLAILGVFSSGGTLSRLAAANPQLEQHQVQAAFIFHFAQMVDWPADALNGSNALVMCTLGDSSSALDLVVDGKQVGGRPIQTRHLREPAAIPGCHLLFIAGKDRKRVTDILAGLKDAPVLTVGESEDFAAAGGIIGFVLQENKIRFDINLNAAQRARLKISSRLLLLARNIIGDNRG